MLRQVLSRRSLVGLFHLHKSLILSQRGMAVFGHPPIGVTSVSLRQSGLYIYIHTVLPRHSQWEFKSSTYFIM